MLHNIAQYKGLRRASFS